jgi:hypothetical protein
MRLPLISSIWGKKPKKNTFSSFEIKELLNQMATLVQEKDVSLNMLRLNISNNPKFHLNVINNNSENIISIFNLLINKFNFFKDFSKHDFKNLVLFYFLEPAGTFNDVRAWERIKVKDNSVKYYLSLFITLLANQKSIKLERQIIELPSELKDRLKKQNKDIVKKILNEIKRIREEYYNHKLSQEDDLEKSLNHRKNKIFLAIIRILGIHKHNANSSALAYGHIIELVKTRFTIVDKILSGKYKGQELSIKKEEFKKITKHIEEYAKHISTSHTLTLFVFIK